MPADLVRQIPKIEHVLEAMSIPDPHLRGLRGRRRPRHARPHLRRTRRELLHRHRRQRLPPAHHRPRRRLQHPQEPGLRRGRTPRRVGHRARPGRRLPGARRRQSRQRPRRSRHRPQNGPAIARNLRHARQSSWSTPPKCPARKAKSLPNVASRRCFSAARTPRYASAHRARLGRQPRRRLRPRSGRRHCSPSLASARLSIESPNYRRAERAAASTASRRQLPTRRHARKARSNWSPTSPSRR